MHQQAGAINNHSSSTSVGLVGALQQGAGQSLATEATTVVRVIAKCPIPPAFKQGDVVKQIDLPGYPAEYLAVELSSGDQPVRHQEDRVSDVCESRRGETESQIAAKRKASIATRENEDATSTPPTKRMRKSTLGIEDDEDDGEDEEEEDVYDDDDKEEDKEDVHDDDDDDDDNHNHNDEKLTYDEFDAGEFEANLNEKDKEGKEDVQASSPLKQATIPKFFKNK